MNRLLERTSTAEAVVNYFTEQIRSGAVAPGDKLPSERVLQERFGISRFALREGLARLSALGIIRIVHGKGAFVADTVNSASLGNVLLPALSTQSTNSLRDLFEARILIERELASRAAERRGTEHLETLDALLDQTAGALADPERFGRLDYEFHRAVAAAAGNVFLMKMLDVLTEHMRDFLARHARSAESRGKALKTHRDIVASIRARDSAQASATMERHLVGCKSNYERSHRRRTTR
ncbi:MAG: FCD domain-containing protein [Chitinivibrionales bacterium]|nr:FCD domain-containing protein [Chitinivibrionales bacterium]